MATALLPHADGARTWPNPPVATEAIRADDLPHARASAERAPTKRPIHSRFLSVGPRVIKRCREKAKRCSQQNKVFEKELARCGRNCRKSTCRRFCHARCGHEEGERYKIGRGGHRRAQRRKKWPKCPKSKSRSSG